jgi:hypothetical protein
VQLWQACFVLKWSVLGASSGWHLLFSLGVGLAFFLHGVSLRCERVHGSADPTKLDTQSGFCLSAMEKECMPPPEESFVHAEESPEVL